MHITIDEATKQDIMYCFSSCTMNVSVIIVQT